MAKAAQRADGQSSDTGGPNGSANQRGPGDGDEDVHSEFLQRIDEWYKAEFNNIMEGRDCQLFYAGGKAQWDEKAWNNRQTKNRPALTINRLPQFVRQATGDIRKNPPSLKFLPAKGQASQETAEALNGLARHIEQQSQAKDVYVKAVENAAQAGQGFFTIDCEYSDDDGFEQDIRIRPILDPFGAGVDPFATRFDKSDMHYGFVFDYFTQKEFEKEFPGKAQVSIPREGFALNQFPWRVNDTITIAAYWRRVPVKRTLYLLTSGAIVDNEKMIPAGDKVKSTREVESFKVEMYRMSGSEKLDGPHPWAGRYIPICMVVGEEITQSGSTVRKGMVHDARDPQRIYNYARSASVEATALQPKAPFIATVAQVKNRPEWQTAGSENHAVLIYNPDPQAKGAPERSQPALASQGLDIQAAIAAQDMQAVTGIYNDSLGAPSQQHSGVAINAKKVEGDTGTFLYPDNLGRAIGYAGKILCDLMPKIYDSERQIRILKEDGAAEMITINPKVPPLPEEGKPPKPIYDLQMGEYDVVVTTGPSFATQRREAAENMIQMVQAQPSLFGIAGDLIVKNMDWPGADELAKRIEKTMPPGLIGDGPIEKPPPDPKTAAGAMKDAALTEKAKAETEGIHIDNTQKALGVETMLAQIGQGLQQIQQFMQAMSGGAGGGPPGPMGGPPPMMPPPNGGAPMNGPPVPNSPPQSASVPDSPPMVEVGGDTPPMVEVEGAPV